jgi:hypothetical protein
VRLIPGSVGAIVGNYKSLLTRRINRLRRTPGERVWQRGYYDRIVWDQRALDAICTYIRNSPARCSVDRENLDALVVKFASCGDRWQKVASVVVSAVSGSGKGGAMRAHRYGYVVLTRAAGRCYNATTLGS